MFFADAYPFPFQYLTGASEFGLLACIDNKRSIGEIANKMRPISAQHIIQALTQLHEKKLVLFR